MPSSNNRIEFLDALPAIEAIVRRHLPKGHYLVDVAIKPSRKSDGSPAPWEVIAYVGGRAQEPEPLGWGHALTSEIRNGWDGADFRFTMQFTTPMTVDDLDDDDV